VGKGKEEEATFKLIESSQEVRAIPFEIAGFASQ
jgi:hypothetical protein